MVRVYKIVLRVCRIVLRVCRSVFRVIHVGVPQLLVGDSRVSRFPGFQVPRRPRVYYAFKDWANRGAGTHDIRGYRVYRVVRGVFTVVLGFRV